MPAMTDPSDALPSFQNALDVGAIQPEMRRGLIDKDLFVYVDQPRDNPRFVYLRVEGKTLTAIAIFARVEHIEGVPCLQVGYAVPGAHRGAGRAAATVKSAIAELRNGFAGNPPFYVEAIVGVNNESSKRVAVATIDSDPTSIVDEVSGLPALRYLRLVVPPSVRELA